MLAGAEKTGDQVAGQSWSRMLKVRVGTEGPPETSESGNAKR